MALGATLVAALFVAGGAVGVYRYGWNYWLYRGFPPPKDPAFVTTAGTTQEISVSSPALGGRSQQVVVYLPPGYASNPTRRYPVFYLLHGFPGRPAAFLLTVRAGVVDDILAARGRGQPLILVMPFGSTGTFTDKEWANGTGPNEGWRTFVSRDVVHAIDSQYRTITSRSGRAIGGLSEGGYGAINIALHAPQEFSLVESWSGYESAVHNHSVFGRMLAGRATNTPFDLLPSVAPALRDNKTYFWFYSGSDDSLQRQNRDFATALTAARIPHTYLDLRGGHNWALWRGMAWRAYLTAAKRLAHA